MTPEEFWAILHAMPEPKPVSWRLYYDDQGLPVCYSMEERPGNYIEIDAELFALAPDNVRVVNGTIMYITQRSTQKLVPGNTGTQCHPRDVAVVVDNDGISWSKTTHGLEQR